MTDTPRSDPPSDPRDVTPVPSPCIDVCRMNPSTGWCDGCLRTIDEIANWSSFDDAHKRTVWDAIEHRHAEEIARLRERT